MFAQFTTSSFENIYDVLPTSLDDDKIKRVRDCVCIWLVVSIISAGPIAVSLYSMFVIDTFLSITILSILIVMFGTIFTFSVYNFVLTQRYLLQLSILKSLTEEKDSFPMRNTGVTEPIGDVSL
ncbi:MAG: hypothetical protein PHG66_02030 [Candidatus Colwellbacteria bacterium]|nr:hypothetical protein [Candidatus Colwellbacteria bacterium]